MGNLTSKKCPDCGGEITPCPSTPECNYDITESITPCDSSCNKVKMIKSSNCDNLYKKNITQCTHDECSHCEVSDWSNWSSCDCPTHKKKKTRTITNQGTFNDCPEIIEEQFSIYECSHC